MIKILFGIVSIVAFWMMVSAKVSKVEDGIYLFESSFIDPQFLLIWSYLSIGSVYYMLSHIGFLDVYKYDNSENKQRINKIK